MFSLAKLIVPESNETKEVDVAQTWEVRFFSTHFDRRYGLSTSKPEMEVFTDREAAEAFAQSLRNAFALTRTTGNCSDVEVAKRPLIR